MTCNFLYLFINILQLYWLQCVPTPYWKLGLQGWIRVKGRVDQRCLWLAYWLKLVEPPTVLFLARELWRNRRVRRERIAGIYCISKSRAANPRPSLLFRKFKTLAEPLAALCRLVLSLYSLNNWILAAIVHLLKTTKWSLIFEWVFVWCDLAEFCTFRSWQAV